MYVFPVYVTILALHVMVLGNSGGVLDYEGEALMNEISDLIKRHMRKFALLSLV